MSTIRALFQWPWLVLIIATLLAALSAIREDTFGLAFAFFMLAAVATIEYVEGRGTE
jgi:hypothetical protein